MQGKAQTPYSYLAQLPPEKVSGKRLLIAEGDLYKGGLTLGLLKNNQWAGQINVTQPGRFIAVLEAADDTYTPTLANNVPGTDGTNHFRISKIGWVDHLQ